MKYTLFNHKKREINEKKEKYKKKKEKMGDIS